MKIRLLYTISNTLCEGIAKVENEMTHFIHFRIISNCFLSRDETINRYDTSNMFNISITNCWWLWLMKIQVCQKVVH